MKKVIFCTNLPSPYRVDFFNEFGKYCDLTVLYERHSSSERNAAWKGAGAENFKEVYLDLKLVGVDRSKGSALKNYVKAHQSDVLIFTNYVSPATMEAIIWCRLHGRKYYFEYDGGFNKKDPFVKKILKKFLLNSAEGHLTTADEHIMYLKSLGIKESRIFKYPFTSVSEDDIETAANFRSKGKRYFKNKLGVKEDKMILSVGRFSYENGYGKGYDILMDTADQLDSSIGIYIVGDEPTQKFIDWKNSKQLENVHFVGFKNKNDLSEYYAAADLFIILSRGDVWGLVVNEAMSWGLPIISSNKCIAGLELVRNGINGFVVNLEDKQQILDCIIELMNRTDIGLFSKNSIEIINHYTFANMVAAHVEYLNL